MKSILAAAVALVFIGPAFAKDPNVAMQQCDRAWSAYHKANPGVKHKDYLSQCLSGATTNPTTGPATKLR